MAEIPLPRSVEDVLKIPGLDKAYAKEFIKKGYEDLEFLLSASPSELERLAKDLSMSSPDLLELTKAIGKAVSGIEKAKKTVRGYCTTLRDEQAKATPSTPPKPEAAESSNNSVASSASTAARVRQNAGGGASKDAKAASDMESQFNRLLQHAGNTSISNEDQKAFESTGSGSTYGYMTWKGLTQMLEGYPTKDKVFYDLGSGVGRPVFAAAMQFPELSKAIGIELSRARHQEAMKVYDNMEEGDAKQKITLMCGSMLDIDLSDADIVYISSLCFPKSFLKRLGVHLDNVLKKGTVVLSSKECPMERATLERRPIVGMSWNLQHQLHGYVITSPPPKSPKPIPEPPRK